MRRHSATLSPEAGGVKRGPSRRLTNEIRSDMARLHVEEGWNLSEIADEYGCTRERVRQILKEDGVPSLTRERQQFQRTFNRIFHAVAVAGYLAAAEVDGPHFRHHGTHYGYVRGCSCDKCREANREYQRRLKGKPPPNHGTASGYLNYGCRCDACRVAGSENNAYWSEVLKKRGHKKRKAVA